MNQTQTQLSSVMPLKPWVYQHVAFHTHKSGNILDLILSDITQDMTVMTTSPGPFITDHRAVIGTLNLKKQKPTSGKKELHQYCKVDPPNGYKNSTLIM